MKKVLILLVLVAASLGLTGCTLTETPSERNRRIAQITDLQLKMLVEDWDYLWLYEEESDLTPWNIWVGI